MGRRVPKLLPCLPIHVDKHLLCISKPAGVTSQTQDRSKVPSAESLARKEFSSVRRAVHRLDKMATGCLLLARTEDAARSLSEAFLEQRVQKHYLVVVSGAADVVPGASGNLRGTLIDEPGRIRVTLGNEAEWPSAVRPRPRRERLLLQ